MSKLVRNSKAVLEQLVVNKAGQVSTKVPCKIQVPARFTKVGLGQIGIDNFIYGLFPIILDTGEYSVCNINALVEIEPFKTLSVKIGEVEYHEFVFEAGQVVIKTTDIVRRDTILYNVFDEFIFKGKVPWYVEYEDLGKLFDTAKSHANSNIAENLEVIEFIASMITRSSNDRTKYIRIIANSYEDVALDKIDYVPLMSVFYSVNSTLNKLAGNYFSEGIVSSLVNKTTEKSELEKILRA